MYRSNANRGAGRPLGRDYGYHEEPQREAQITDHHRWLSCFVAGLIAFACSEYNLISKRSGQSSVLFDIDPSMFSVPAATNVLYGLRALFYRVCNHIPLQSIQICELLPYRSPITAIRDEASVRDAWSGLFCLALIGGLVAGPTWMYMRHSRSVSEYIFPVGQGVVIGALLFTSLGDRSLLYSVIALMIAAVWFK